MRRRKLPAPRLQLRWLKSSNAKWDWECRYELVIPLGEHDIRREVRKNGRLLKRTISELVVQIKEPSFRGSTETPCCTRDGMRYCDTPYRDGAHALWDAEKLGKLPIFVIAPDGMEFEHKAKQQ